MAKQVKIVLIVSKCKEVFRLKKSYRAIFPFRGVYRGVQLKKVSVKFHQNALILKDKEYVVKARVDKIEGNCLYAELIDLKHLLDIKRF